MKWLYGVQVLSGNFHGAVEWINTNHPDWDVVTMEIVGLYTLVVYRVPTPTV